jgi:hypothetical protein
VAIARARAVGLINGNVHGHRHVDLALRELAKRILDGLDGVGDGQALHNRVVIEHLRRGRSERARRQRPRALRNRAAQSCEHHAGLR